MVESEIRWLNDSNLPREILEPFVKYKGTGYKQIIRGREGSGKSTLALEILSELKYYYGINGIYFDTRNKISNISDRYKKGEHAVTISKYKFQDDVNKNSYAIIEESKDFDVIAIDSLDGFFGDSMQRDKFPSILKQHLNGHKDNDKKGYIFVEEKVNQPTGISSLANGEILLERYDENLVGNREIRRMIIEKMGGIGLENKKNLFTLQNGEFKSFCRSKPSEFNPMKKRGIMARKIADVYETGITDLDDLLEAETSYRGFKSNSINLLEISKYMNFKDYEPLLIEMISNSVSNYGMVCLTPPESLDYDHTIEILEPFLEKECLDDIMISSFSKKTGADNLINLSPNLKESFDKFWGAVHAYVDANPDIPVLQFVSYDTIENIYGREEETLKFQEKQTKGLVKSEVQAVPGFRLNMVYENSSRTERLRSEAKNGVIIKMQSIEGVPVLYIDKPGTSVNVIKYGQKEDGFDISLFKIE